MPARDLIDLISLGAIWGASFLFMRIAAPEFGPVPLIATRVGVGAIFLIFVLAKRGGMKGVYHNAAPLIILGAINAAVPFSLFAYAVLSVTAGFASVLNSTVPLFGALVAVVWLRDRLSLLRIIGLLIGFGGVLILVWPRLAAGDSRDIRAVLAGLAAAVLYGISANYTKRRLGRVEPIVTATGSLLAATAILLPVAILEWPVVAPTRMAWVCALLLGVACTGVAYIYYYRLINSVGPAKTVTVTYLIPVFGVLWGRVFLHETLTTTMLTACAVILVGTALATGAVSFANRPTLLKSATGE